MRMSGHRSKSRELFTNFNRHGALLKHGYSINKLILGPGILSSTGIGV